MGAYGKTNTSELVADCPRCGAKSITFDLTDDLYLGKINTFGGHWKQYHEVFCICRHCRRTTTFMLFEKENLDHHFLPSFSVAVNEYVEILGHVSAKDEQGMTPPEHLPEKIEQIFNEGARCFAIGCFNAAGAMFRLCIDLATKSLLPEDDTNGLNGKIKRNLGLRLPWLFKNNFLPEALKDLSSCIKDDGNDGAHDGT